MRPKKATPTLLAGACFIPAIILAGPAGAEGTIFTGDYGTLEIVEDTDFVILDSAFHATGDVINAATIEPGDENGVSFAVDGNAVIDGSLINDGLIAATKPAAAVALSVNGEVGDILNDGLISASASASANAAAVAISQNRATAGTTRLSNFGDVLARAIATADVTPLAQAPGYRAQSTDHPLDLDVFNGGLIDVWASASGEGASVIAVGMFLTGPEATGLIHNDGSVVAYASAEGSGGVASAGGILVPANVVTVDIVNSGLISTYAEGETAISTGIMIVPPFTAVAGNPASQAPLATITNDRGTIIASASTDGDGIQRGTAISTENAPNQVLINLTGGDEGGYIFGSINISADDAIVVADGGTRFDGIVNSAGARLGSLAIADSGYFLLLNREQGASAAFVDSFTLSSYGTLGLELTADPERVPFISTNLADLAGRLDVVYQPGLYSDFTTYEGLVRADQRTSAFAALSDNSALLRTDLIGDGGDIDLAATRLGFGALPGLTRNQASAGNAIERVYRDTNADTAFGRLVGNLFILNEDEYPVVLNALAGADYAQYLQSVLQSTSLLDRVINARIECAGDFVGGPAIQPVADIAVESSGCFQPGQMSLWGQVSGSGNKQDGDEEASGYDEDQVAIMVGADYALSESIFAGVAAGYFDSRMDFNWSNNAIDYDGAQLAVYGGYDDSEDYVRGVLTYGSYDGDSRRHVPSDATLDGDPDSDDVSFYGELGRRYTITPESRLTPFAGMSVARAHIEGFAETDAEEWGAALTVHGSDGNSLVSVLGLRLTADWALGPGSFRPEISVAWMHEFDDTRQSVDLSFADAPDAADFSVESAKIGRDMAIIGLRALFALSESVDLSLVYDGRFAADYSSNAAIGRIDVKF